MNKLTIVGLGPGSKEFLTLEAYQQLTKKVRCIYVRLSTL